MKLRTFVTESGDIYEEKLVMMSFKVPETLYNLLKLRSLIENRPMTDIVFNEKLEKKITSWLDSQDQKIVKHFMDKYKNKDS